MIPGPKSRALAGRLRAVENPTVTYLAPDETFPIFWESARGCTVVDVDGNEFLDLTAAFGVASVGHANPRVVDAIVRQAQILVHGMGDVHPSRVKVELLERLETLVPGDLSLAILGTSGGDAVEAAIKSARKFTGKSGVLAFSGGYHGLNLGTLAVTFRPDFRDPFSGQIPPFSTHLPYGCSLDRIDDTLSSRPEIGAILVEPIQGRGGIVVPPGGWLCGLRELCDRRGVLLIFDEIFTGFCRTGNWFACEFDAIVPDLLCVGKALGGGVPISACVGKPEIMESWGVSTGEALHTSTFLGSPLACAAALAALSEMDEKNLCDAARSRGARFLAGLDALKEKRPEIVKEVRGRGLMLGIRLDGAPRCLALVTELLRRGLIVLPAGDGDILEFTPPLTITDDQIDFALHHLEEALGR